MPYLIIGLIIGMPIGVLAYFHLLSQANEAGAREATRINRERANHARPIRSER